jgi:heat shock protein HslJ
MLRHGPEQPTIRAIEVAPPMRRLLFTALAVAALALPAQALAADPPSRAWEIRALVLGGVRLDSAGKLGLSAGQLSASAGCNAIGGAATLDGDTVTITGPTWMTEMACQGPVADAEAMLIKILSLGRFTIDANGWTADGGQIIAVEVEAPAPPPPGDPNQPVSSTPEPGLTLDECQAFLNANAIPPDAGSGSGGSTGSGGGSTGSGSGTSTGTIEPGTAVDTPLSVPPIGPEMTFQLGQGETPAEPPIAPLPTVEGKPSSGGTSDPAADATPDPVMLEQCLALVAKVQGVNGTGAVVTDPGGPAPGSPSDTFAAREDAARDIFIIPFAVILGLVVVATLILYRRPRPS